MISKFNKGDKVILRQGCYDDSAGDPIWNGRFGKIIGTVTAIRASGSIIVKWDNGRQNPYSHRELLPYPLTESSTEGILKIKIFNRCYLVYKSDLKKLNSKLGKLNKITAYKEATKKDLKTYTLAI